jgi:hypothetical protein
MIAKTVIQCVDDLRTRWGHVRVAIEAIDDLPDFVLPTPTTGPASSQVATVPASWGKWVEQLIDSIPAHATLDLAQKDFATLFPLARTTLQNSLSDLVTIEGLQTGIENSGALPDDNEELGNLRSSLADLRHQIEECLGEILALTSEIGQRASLAGIRNSVDNVATYPVLTQETGIAMVPSSPGAGPAGAGAPIGQIVERELREALAWRPRKSDPSGFVAALTQAFTCTEVEGRTECTWTPRSFAVQADIGAVTGAQASIYTRAKVALDQSVPLLEGLSPLRSDADDEDVDATRAVVGAQLKELVDELGIQGGPRVQRADVLFELLLGTPPGTTLTDPAKVGGKLGELRDEFGMDREEVNTVEEEQNLTNFLILVDYVNSLKASWDSQRGFFDRVGSDVFLGTQLLLLSRGLAVLSESVQETYLAMDSVFMGAAERQTTELLFDDDSPMFVADLLDWVGRFASEEAPRLIRDGGKAGVSAFFPTIDRLRQLVRAALLRAHGGAQSPDRLPGGYRTTRVQRAVEELAGQLDETARLARPFQSRPATKQAAKRPAPFERFSSNGR